MSSNDRTRYLYVSREVMNIVKFSLLECILNLLKAAIMSSLVRYLHSWICAKISSINGIE